MGMNAKHLPLTGHALRNARLRERALERARQAPPLAGALVRIRAEVLGMTRLEFARRSGISRGTLRDLELGLHSPTRRILRKFVAFCQRREVDAERLNELEQLYTGSKESLGQFLARLELHAGSPRELARRVGISPTTLWEYRRGNFPLPVALLRKLCAAVGEESLAAEQLWHQAERQRFIARGYPPALAEFWALCAREGRSEGQLLALGMSTATVRRLRYLELPPWEQVEPVARRLCRSLEERGSLKQLWLRDWAEQEVGARSCFGLRLQKLRKQQGISRRELADLFRIGGKKPARILKYIEEDGFYSVQAYPAGLAALLATADAERERLLALWQDRRRSFHRRRRPETRVELRLARELYGFAPRDLERVLGYTNLEYQRIERGVMPLLDAARERILDAIHAAGQRKVAELLQRRREMATRRAAWQTPPTAAALVRLLADREGGLIPLMRHLRRAGLKGLWVGRLRVLAQGNEVPSWPVLDKIAVACGVQNLDEVRRDWRERYREALARKCPSPLGVDLRLLIAEVAPTLRAFSPRLGFNYSVLVRDLQRIDRDESVRWFHVERILTALAVPRDGERWREIHALWYTSQERRRKTAVQRHPTAARQAVEV